MGAGKGEATRVLKDLGFDYITLSQMVREEARKQGVPEEREQLMKIGNGMRAAEGAGVLAKRALEKIAESDNKNWVVDGIRNPAEIDELKKGEKVHVLGLHADKEILIERILKRNRDSDPNDREGIIHRIEREWGKNEAEDGQQMERCMQKVDLVIENEGTLEELDEKIIAFYNEALN